MDDGPSSAGQPAHGGRSVGWMAHGDVEAARLAILQRLSENPDMSQREISEQLGLSLGKTHYVLHALLDKGLLKIRNFKNSRRKSAYAYVLTPSGLTEKVRLTRRFLARKEAEFEVLQQVVSNLRRELDQLDRGRSPHE